ncbi:hypothetical protein [Pseudoalteromonas pernae]|uniref:hypothetical protein n=1 Tax=Pseudoalteromonas pernae TaxID=3118054 RepID=UPI003242CD2F
MTQFNNNKLTPIFTALGSVALLTLGACSSDSDDSSDTGAIQLYNGTINGPTMTLTIEDVARTSAELGNVTTTHSYTSDDYSYAIQYTNDQGNLVDLVTDEIEIKGDTKSLLVMYGDIAEQLMMNIELPMDDFDDEFTLQLLNITQEGRHFDLYMAEDDGVFDQAELITSAAFETLSEAVTIENDSYTFYLTEAGDTTSIWQSDVVNISADEALVFVLRPSYDNNSDFLTMDIISNSNSAYTLKNQDAGAQVQFYNSMDEYTNTTFRATKNNEVHSTEPALADTVTPYLELSANSYSISMLDESGGSLVDNYLLTLEQEQSVLGVFYNDEQYGPRLLSVTQNLVPSSVTHAITVVNLVDQYAGLPVTKLDFYFTLDGQPISQTEHHLDGVSRYSTKSINLLDKAYEFYAILEDNGQQIVIHQEGDVDFTDDGNYILILERDTQSSSGYKLTPIHTVLEETDE